MIANQLRLGNYVMLNLDPDHYLHHKLNGKIGIVNSIIDNGERPFSIRIKYIENETQEYNAHQVSVNIISPIPLTEELLEKLGFDRILTLDNSECTYALDIGIGRLLMIDIISRTIWINKIKGNRTVCSFHIFPPTTEYEILNLHQLQNLYYTLIGKDITINL